MSTKPPISSLGSAPLMSFSSPAASMPLIQSRRSLLGMFSLHYPDDPPCLPPEAVPTVYPSAGAFAINSMAILPPAPVRFSTTKGCHPLLTELLYNNSGRLYQSDRPPEMQLRTDRVRSPATTGFQQTSVQR